MLSLKAQLKKCYLWRRPPTKVNFYFFKFLFLFAFFFPLFRNHLGTAGAILINGFLIICMLYYFVFLLDAKLVFKDRHLLRIYLYVVFVFVFMLLHIPIATAIGIIFGSIQPIIRDFFELHRPILYMSAVTVGFFTFNSLTNLKKLNDFLLIIFIILVLFGLNHYFHLSELVTSIYTKEANAVRFRVAVPFVNPYDYAFVMSFFVFYFFISTLYKSRWYAVMFILSVVMFILPQSRSVAAGMLVGLLIVLPFTLFYLNFNSRLVFIKPFIRLIFFFLVMVVGLFAMIPYLLENFPYLTNQFVIFFESGDVGNSGGIRLKQFYFSLNKAQNPLIFLIGNGPAKDEMEYVESIYNYQFYRYGFIGILLYFFYPLVLGGYFLLRILKKLDYKSGMYPMYLAFLLWFATIPLMSIGNNFTEQIRISFFYYSMLGMVARSYYLIVLNDKKTVQ
jgi:hypothetical protein